MSAVCTPTLRGGKPFALCCLPPWTFWFETILPTRHFRGGFSLGPGPLLRPVDIERQSDERKEEKDSTDSGTAAVHRRVRETSP